MPEEDEDSSPTSLPDINTGGGTRDQGPAKHQPGAVPNRGPARHLSQGPATQGPATKLDQL